MIDELRAMAIFAQVVKLGSFRAAAKALKLSPSVVSYHVAQLEQQVGTALIYRSTRKLSLSHEGKVLVKHIDTMMHAAQQGLDEISHRETKLTGKLAVTLPTALIKSPITKQISLFAHQHPNVALSLLYSDSREDIIANGIDLAISAGELTSSNLKAKRIGKIQRTLVCSPECYARYQTPTQPQQLAQWQWLKLAMLPNYRDFQHPDFGKVKVPFSHQLSVNTVDAMVQLCLLGHGLATPANYQVNDLITQGQLVQVLPQWQITPIPLYAVWPNNVAERSLTKQLLTFISDKST
ncbi:transcriptional regulator [Thalassotalea insulae]|uniref:Transcriptional regulator n=1 Tax=Thalassotalea insulae TaxID=2056778 RepID=A0ABQ6GWY4_9GAMM|nr:LysR family transcriptional regulator [Thalassotalea insulae]GLX78666.1 transcriptional regulator [Thalassotalea insulae]